MSLELLQPDFTSELNTTIKTVKGLLTDKNSLLVFKKSTYTHCLCSHLHTVTALPYSSSTSITAAVLRYFYDPRFEVLDYVFMTSKGRSFHKSHGAAHWVFMAFTRNMQRGFSARHGAVSDSRPTTE